MFRVQKMAIVNGTLCTPQEVHAPGTVLVDAGKITAAGASSRVQVPPGIGVVDASDCHVVPGLIDLHIHGLGGSDVMGAGLERVIRALPAYGVTSFLATTLTAPEDATLSALADMARIIGHPPPGARCLGIHLEGPFLSPRRPGMATSELFLPLTWERVQRYARAAEGQIRLLTFAPELAGGMGCIERLIEAGIIPSIGHSDATFDEVAQAVGLGLRHATHTFNAMRPLHHREPGVVGAVLSFPEVVAELIADGVHIHAAVVELVLRIKGAEGVALVSDAAPLAGLPDGQYTWAEQTIVVESGSCRLTDGTIAGAHALLDTGVRTLVNTIGLPLAQALTAASTTPAAVLGLRAGEIRPGHDADIVLLDESLRPVRTFVGGAEVFRRSLPL
jgi:N-acetylglucosamine-6-phosphate deacetylase